MDVTGEVALFFTPADVVVTLTAKVQEVLAGSVALPRDTVPDPCVAVIVPPPQVPIRPFGVDTTTPPGKVSVKPTPVSGTEFVFVIVKAKVELPPTVMVLGLNAFIIIGGPTTVSVAAAGSPFPPLVDVTAEVVLFFTPTVDPVTLNDKVHDAPGAKVTPTSENVVDPAVAPVGVPPQLLTKLGVVATATPSGSGSKKAMPVSVTAGLIFGFPTVKVKTEVPFRGILGGVKDLASVGGLITFNVSHATPVVAGGIQFWDAVPGMLLSTTLTVTLQNAKGPKVAPLSEKLGDPAVAPETVPPQLFVRLGTAAMTTPTGSGSLKPTPVRANPAFWFVMVMATVEVPFIATVFGLNVLMNVGGVSTDSVAQDWVVAFPPF